MGINLTAVVIILVVLVAIFAVLYFIGYFRADNAEPVEPTTNDTNDSTDQAQNITSSKVDIITLKEGDGPAAKNGDKLTVNYTGTLTNGTKFDSSLDDGREPFTLTLGAGQVIKGWEDGLVGMKVGEKRKLTIPAELGYGSNGVGDKIPPDSTLIFEVELLKIN